MKNRLDYEAIFEKYFSIIRSYRDPKSEKTELSDFNWNETVQQNILCFNNTEFKKYNQNIENASFISVKCLEEIICRLQSADNIFDYLDIGNLRKDIQNLCFALKDRNKKEVIFFKQVEESRLWKRRDKEPNNIQDFIENNGATSCKYVYLMYDYAYKQVFGYDDNEEDCSRNTNFYSIKWFFEEYFGEEEYIIFNKEWKQYIQNINDYLGYLPVKALSPNSMYHFRMIVENHIRNHGYDKLCAVKMKGYEISKNDFLAMKEQFFNNKTYMISIGDSDFSESIITAEWLRDSMWRASAIDLTVIATGYFKAIEQLLYSLICLHKNEKRMIKKENSSERIEVCDTTIDENSMDTSIGSMAVFFKRNLNMLNKNLHPKTHKYIREAIFAYKDLRNGYLHKDNIHQWNVVEEIRDATFNLIFLLLSSFEFTDEYILKLGYNKNDEYSDYEKLCEYVNYHANNLFLLEFDYGEQIAVGCRDPHSKILGNRKINYSGVYFREFIEDGKTYRFKEDVLPKEIYLGKLQFAESEYAKCDIVKVVKVFSNGKFVGPLLADEQNIEY